MSKTRIHFLQTRRNLHLLIALCVVICAAAPAMAWNSTGHMLAALIAWQEMDDSTRVWAVALLRQHPRFDLDFAHDLATESGGQGDAWIFARAATWPDIARGFEPPDRDEYNRPQWHFVDAPVFLDMAARQKERPQILPDADPTLAPTPQSMNAIQALTFNLDMLNAPDATIAPPQKAVALCWVLHLIGDIHQPLHCATLVSARRFDKLPFGDRGGNDIPISETEGITARAKPRPNLHALWDNILGESRSMHTLENDAARCTAAHPRSSFAAELQERDFLAWALEGHALAETAAYSPMIVAAVEAGEAHPYAPLPEIALGEDYLSNARAVAQSQIALAGYRITDVVASIKK